MSDLDKLAKQMLEAEQTPDESLETMDAAEELIGLSTVPYGLVIAEEDKDNYLTISGKVIYFPPEGYKGKELTAVAFIDMLRNNKVIPITIGNIRLFTSWEKAKEMFGYAVLFKHLMDTYHIIPKIGD